MAAPVTMGKLCTSTSEMEIGDYIKCVYENVALNEAGYFSQLGVENPTYTQTTITNGGTPVVEEVPYEELSTDPATISSGYFYLLKADYGLLIADRMVQSQISWEMLNKKNYIYGCVFDVAKAKTNVIIEINTSTKTLDADNDVASDTTETEDNFADMAKRQVITTRTQVELDTENNITTTTITKTTTNYAVIEDEETPDSSTTETDPDAIISKIPTSATTMFY